MSTNDETIAALIRQMDEAAGRGRTDEEEGHLRTMKNFSNLILEAGELAQKQGLPGELLLQVYAMCLGKLVHQIFPTRLSRLGALIVIGDALSRHAMED